MHFKYEEKNYAIERYPSSDNKSLRAWSAADEYLLRYLKENSISHHKPLIYNDRFGFLSTILSKQQPNIIINYKSQEKSLEINLKKHDIDLNTISKTRPLDKLETPFDLVLIKIPKSLDLFRFQLDQLHESLKENSVVVCAFMTKYFSAQILKIANSFTPQIEKYHLHVFGVFYIRVVQLARLKHIPILFSMLDYFLKNVVLICHS